MSVVGHDPIPLIHLMEDHDTAYDVWKAAGLQNRTLVHFDGHLDFNWIQRRSPHDLLNAKSSAELDRLLAETPRWDLQETSPRQRIHIGNFIAPAVEEGIISTFYWVIPDPFWDRDKERKAVLKDLRFLHRSRPSDSSAPVAGSRAITMTLFGRPLTVCPLKFLPRIDETVLLDMDIDYFVTDSFEAPPPYYQSAVPAPWMLPSAWGRQMRSLGLKSDFATVCYSVNQGYTPLKTKFVGDNIAEWMRQPSRALRDAPKQGSAGEAFAAFGEAQANGDETLAGEWWREMWKRDASYRTLYATPAFREETWKKGSVKKAIQGFRELVALDPEWHVAHFALGRSLWRASKWGEAEAAFQEAVERSSGPTFALYWLGLCRSRRGLRKEAVDLWRAALKAFPGNPVVADALRRAGASPSDELTGLQKLDGLLSRHPAVRWHSVDNEVAAFHPATNELVRLPMMAGFVWRQLEKPRSHNALLEACAATFDAPSELLARDLARLLRLLGRLGFLEGFIDDRN